MLCVEFKPEEQSLWNRQPPRPPGRAHVLAVASESGGEVEACLSHGFMFIQRLRCQKRTDFQSAVRRSLITFDCYPFAWWLQRLPRHLAPCPPPLGPRAPVSLTPWLLHRLRLISLPRWPIIKQAVSLSSKEEEFSLWLCRPLTFLLQLHCGAEEAPLQVWSCGCGNGAELLALPTAPVAQKVILSSVKIR